ncbi:MAG: hypothetical protein IPN08_09940 [Bacteroidales bacterium]|nr:hypothetical protein [Bacteroidales bacterium]MBK9357690.1 hypothetical protein [Bacteroidales bacterium]
MKQELSTGNTVNSFKINRWAYAAFVILSAVLWITGDTSSAVINFSIAMVFDPFDQEVKWGQRPLYQRIWMIAHVCLSFAGLFFTIFGDIK